MAPTAKTPARVPLTGADCFLRAFDGEIGRYNGASHVSQLVLRLGPGFDPTLLEKLVGEVARAQPIVRAPICRRFGIGAPMYQIAAATRSSVPRTEVHEAQTSPTGDAQLPEIFFERLNQPLDLSKGELLRFDVVRRADGSDLAASWAHLLLDGSGSEGFVRWLDQCFRGEGRPERLPLADELAAREAARTPLRQRGDAAMAWQRWVEGFGAMQLRSLAGPLRRTPQALRYDVLTLSPQETAEVVERARERAGFLTPMLFYLAAAIRAHHAVFRARGVDPGSYVVPLPVNLRPRGSERAIFRTHVSLLWFQLRPEQVEDFAELLATLKQQRLAAIKAGRVEQGSHAMGFARFAPKRLYTRLARSHLRGELCSFFFAYTGAFLPGLERFLGARVENGFHVAPVPPSPGSCVAISLCGDRLNATHVRQRGVFSDREHEIFRAQLRSDLLGQPTEWIDSMSR